MSQQFFSRIGNAISRSALFVAVLPFSILVACSSGPSEGDIAEAVNAVIQSKKTCYSLKQNNVTTWPLRVQRPLGAFSQKPLDPILAAMQSAGYLTITQEKQRSGIMQIHLDVIAATDEAQGWWKADNGFCLGNRKVDEVLEWTEPTEESGKPIVATFTWNLDAPSWAQKPEFNGIEGLGESVRGQAVLHKTNKGWGANVR